MNAAREIIAEKQSIEFTVQEIVDQSRQSLRSFYQYFDGKHELLLSLFEEEMDMAVNRLREVSAAGGPIERLEQAVLLLFEICSPDSVSVQPLFADFAQSLAVTHPEEVEAAWAPLVEYTASIVDEIGQAGMLRPGRPRRLAAILLQTATVTAGRGSGGRHPITGTEVWEFCLHAIVPDEVFDVHTGASTPAPAARRAKPSAARKKG